MLEHLLTELVCPNNVSTLDCGDCFNSRCSGLSNKNGSVASGTILNKIAEINGNR